MSMEDGEPKKERLAIEIGPPRPEETREIVELLRSGWLDTYESAERGITREDIVAFWENELKEEHLAARAKNYEQPRPGVFFRVARAEGKVVGLLQVRTGGEQNVLQTLYVDLDPKYLRKGIGTALFAEGRALMDPTKDTILEVVPYNERAKAFYRTLGFVETGEPEILNERLRLASGNILPEVRMRRPADIQSKA